MLCVVAIVALQGAADPAAGRSGSEAWVSLHLFGRIGLTGVIAGCLQLQRSKIADQQSLIEEVLAEVRAMREARGLDVEHSEDTAISAGV